MADKKIEKALYGPSTTEVALGAVLGLIAGLLVACVYLVFKPVFQVKELPKETSRGAVYFIPGSEAKAKSGAWQAKLKNFTAGKSVTLNEDELNAWAAATLSATPPPKPAAPGAKPAPAEAKPAEPAKANYDGILNPGTPNFKLVNGTMQIGFKCVLNWYGMTYEVIVLTTGTFTHSGDDVVYSPKTLYLGSCPIHFIPGAAGPLMSQLLARKKAPDEINSAWAKVKEATLDGTALTLTLE
jgi:hypothetical protein